MHRTTEPRRRDRRARASRHGVIAATVLLVASAVGCDGASDVGVDTTATPAVASTPTPTSELGAPTDVSAVPAAGLVMPAWRAPSGEDAGDVSDFVVQFRTTAGPGPWTTFADPVSTTNASSVTGLTDGTSYDFRVAATGSGGSGSWSDVVTATPGTVPALTLDFDMTDGPYPPLPNFDPDTYRSLRVVADRLQTLDDGEMYAGIVAHGVDVSGDWQLDFDVHAPLDIGAGGATVALVDATFSGWAIFAGNATHIQEYSSGDHVNATNDGRAAEDQHITVTRHAADGVMRVYADGVLQGTTTNTSRVAGDYVAVFLQSAASPAFEVWIDDLVVQGSADD